MDSEVEGMGRALEMRRLRNRKAVMKSESSMRTWKS